MEEKKNNAGNGVRPAAKRDQKGNLVKLAAENSALIALVILLILATVLTAAMKGINFLQPSNLINILNNNAYIGIIALGMTLVILIGGIDLSVGSQLAITGLFACSVLNMTGSILLAVLTAIAAALAFGFITGGLVAKFRIPAFIVTLGTMTIYRSVAQYIYKGGGITVNAEHVGSFTAISNTKLFGVVPMPIIYWIILSIIVGVFMAKTATGRHIYATGSNEKATKLSGINVNRIKVIVFMISGALVAMAAVFEASRLGSMNSASSGTSYEMDAIAAVVIGGTSMSGGRGKIIGTVFGTLTIGVINNMMTLLGVPPFLVGAVKGVIIIVAVLFQRRLDGKEAA